MCELCGPLVLCCSLCNKHRVRGKWTGWMIMCLFVVANETWHISVAHHGVSLLIYLFICLHSDEEELRKSFSELGDSLCDSNTSRSMKGEGSSGKPLSDGMQPSGTPLYKNGFLVRKVHADSDGKRSTRHLRFSVSSCKFHCWGLVTAAVLEHLSKVLTSFT